MVFTAEKKESKYTFTVEERGFEVSAEGRTTTRVILDDDGLKFRVSIATADVSSLYFYLEDTVPLPDYYKLVKYISTFLLHDWKRPDPKWQINFDLYDWIHNSVSRAIGKRVWEQWKRLLQLADPTAYAIQKRVFSVSFGRGDWYLLENPEFYKQLTPEVVKDIMKYNQAASLIVYFDQIKFLTDNTNFSPDAAEAGRRFNNWRNAFSDTGTAYTSLNKTFENLPGGCTAFTYLWLRNVHLPEPVTNRMKLLAYSALGDSYFSDLDDASAQRVKQCHTQAILRSTPDQIRKAVHMVCEYYHSKTNFKSQRDIALALTTVFRYPYEHHCELPELTRRALSYEYNRRYTSAYSKVGFYAESEHSTVKAILDAKFPSPSIEPPNIEGVTYLSTARELIDASLRDRSGAFDMLADAREGYIYFFSVEWKGINNIVGVYPRSGQVQVFKNQFLPRGKVSLHGARSIRKWARSLAKLMNESINNSIYKTSAYSEALIGA